MLLWVSQSKVVAQTSQHSSGCLSSDSQLRWACGILVKHDTLMRHLSVSQECIGEAWACQNMLLLLVKQWDHTVS